MDPKDSVADRATWHKHLDSALGSPDPTVILASVGADRSMCIQVIGTRPQDMLDVARSLIEQAKDRLEEASEDEQGDLVETLEEVLELLPDPLADDDDPHPSIAPYGSNRP
jgi:hypothetical protein